MKKVLRTVTALILTLACCIAFAACKDEKTLEGLKNEYGASIDGGAFPEGATLLTALIDEASEQGKEALSAINGQDYDTSEPVCIFDISVVKDNIRLQPNGKVKVTVPVTADLAGCGLVFHIRSDKTVERLSATCADGKVSFETESFSVFVLVKNNETPAENPVGGSSEKPADGAMTEAEWNAAISYWKNQTNVRVTERISSPHSADLGAQIMLYQFKDNVCSEDGYFEGDQASQDYKGKAVYYVKEGDRYCLIQWYDESGRWDKRSDEYLKEAYEGFLKGNIYGCGNHVSSEGEIDFSYSSFTYDATASLYKSNDGNITVAFTLESGVLTKIVVTQYRASDSMTFVSTFTFGNAEATAPDVTEQCFFSVSVKAGDTYHIGGYITENGEQVRYHGDVDFGTVVTLTAVASPGYKFKCWGASEWNGEEYEWITFSTKETYEITVDKNNTYLVALFEATGADS